MAIAKTALPKVVFWSYAESNLLPGQIPTAGFVNNPGSCMPLKQMFALAGHENPTKAIQDAQVRPNGVRNLLERVGSAATKHLVSVWKDYRGVSINLIQNGEHIDATIEDTFNHYDMARRSDGFKRFVTFILLVSAQAKTKSMENTLYLHDEPDISLHPSGARYLRDELIKISAKNYVVYSTHSIFMIDRESIGRHLIVKKKKEVTSVETVSDSNIVDEEVIYNALGHSVFECLRPMNIIFEGWRDKRLFIVSLPEFQKTAKADAEFLSEIGRCHAKGVKDIGRITPMIELAARRCIILSDGDTVAREHQKEYDGYGKWIRYDELLPGEIAATSEDFLRPELFETTTAAARNKYPQLLEFNIADFAPGESKLRALERWLQKSGVQGDTKKEILNEIKGALIRNLKPALIEDKYFELLKTLAASIRSEMNS